MPHLGIQVQVSLASGAGINGELCRLVHDAASGFQARPKGLHLCRGRSGGLGQGLEEGPLAPSWPHMQGPQLHLVWEAVGHSRLDVGNEGRVLDVLIITDDMHGVLPGLCGPVPHIAGAIPLVITLDLGL